MRKHDELNDPKSCLNRARPDEMIFTLLGRDKAAPATIRFWIEERLRLGENWEDDSQIIDARRCAMMMERENDNSNPR